jgi:hypothetical protein
MSHGFLSHLETMSINITTIECMSLMCCLETRSCGHIRVKPIVNFGKLFLKHLQIGLLKRVTSVQIKLHNWKQWGCK